MGPKSRWVVRAVGVGLIVVAGCGGPGGVPTYPVRGKVVLKGGEVAKLVGGSVRLESVAEPKVTGSGELGTDGGFVVGCLLDGKDRDGLPAGDYRACLRPPRDADEARGWVKLVAAKYQNFDKSALRLTVTTGANEPTFEVER